MAFSRVAIACSLMGVAVAEQTCTAQGACEPEQDESTLLSLRAHLKAKSPTDCPGSPGVQCEAGQCCPKTSASGWKTFPCPSDPHFTGCEALSSSPAPPPPTDYEQCKTQEEAACRGCGGEQCSFCRWDGALKCCLDDICHGCQGTQCLTCRDDQASLCCHQEGIPSWYHKCGASPAPTPPAGQYEQCKTDAEASCRGCGGEQCSYCQWDGALECCQDDLCHGCQGTQCLTCKEDKADFCCRQEGIPSTYHKCGASPAPTPPAGQYEQCKTDAEASCRGCGGEQCSYCQWDGALDCCLNDICHGCQGTQCLECKERQAGYCCHQEGVPSSYHKCTSR